MSHYTVQFTRKKNLKLGIRILYGRAIIRKILKLAVT
jgi:hypothetical protein